MISLIFILQNKNIFVFLAIVRQNTTLPLFELREQKHVENQLKFATGREFNILIPIKALDSKISVLNSYKTVSSLGKLNYRLHDYINE